MFWKKDASPKFIAANELGRLARWIRLLGYDCVYYEKKEKRELIITSLRENRIILTREKGISKYSGIRMIHIKKDFVEDQVRQILTGLRLEVDEDKMFTRCTVCNTPIEEIAKKDAEDLVPPYVYKTQDNFKKCPNCKKIYWKGTHWNLATGFLKERAKA